MQHMPPPPATPKRSIHLLPDKALAIDDYSANFLATVQGLLQLPFSNRWPHRLYIISSSHAHNAAREAIPWKHLISS